MSNIAILHIIRILFGELDRGRLSGEQIEWVQIIENYIQRIENYR